MAGTAGTAGMAGIAGILICPSPREDSPTLLQRPGRGRRQSPRLHAGLRLAGPTSAGEPPPDRFKNPEIWDASCAGVSFRQPSADAQGRRAGGQAGRQAGQHRSMAGGRMNGEGQHGEQHGDRRTSRPAAAGALAVLALIALWRQAAALVRLTGCESRAGCMVRPGPSSAASMIDFAMIRSKGPVLSARRRRRGSSSKPV